MSKNQNRRRGPSQEERRRKAASRPLGGLPQTSQNQARPSSSNVRKPSRFERYSGIVAIIMLIAIVLSLIPACFASTPTAGAAPLANQDAPAASLSLGSARNLEREAAESVPTASLPRPQTTLPPDKAYLGDTGHIVTEPFLTFWRNNGSREILGNPLSEEFTQNGHTAQLFERALLELHPESSDSKNLVQLGFLGRQLAEARGLRFEPGPNSGNSATRTYFPETGQSVSGAFKTFWATRDGLRLLGLPISPERIENGLTVQYFERGLLQLKPGGKEAATVDAGTALIEAKGWPRPTILNLSLDIEADEIYQGRTLLVKVEPDTGWQPLELRGSVGDEKLRMVQTGSNWRAFRSFAPWAEPKNYPLQVLYTDPAGRSRELLRPINVVKFDFKTQNLYLPDDKSQLTDKANDDYDNAQLATTYATFTPQMLWSGVWAYPVYGEITTDFAQRRAYGDSTDYENWHGGLDIAQPLGTAVQAPAVGRVLYVGTLKARGKAIALDHGLGVTSYYYHLNSTLVKPGDLIKKGQVLGQVGTTGRSNGPHLHWEVRVNGTITYPGLFTGFNLSD